MRNLHKEHIIYSTPSYKKHKLGLLSFIFCLLSFTTFAQITTEIDTTTIRVGEQISYKIKVESDSTNLVVFPEGQTFTPLESVEALDIDTTRNEAKFKLSRIYKLTQFDSGQYTIPRQKIIIGDKPFFTDSLKVTVNTIKVDTTEQNLYDIKPIIEVEKSVGNWWKWLLGIIVALALVAFLLYWFIWRPKPLTEEEEIALLSPYERAKLAIKKLDESQYLIRSEVKEYYSDLTFVIRKYLDEKVYDHALESTTDELISRLNVLKDGNQIDLSKDTIKNLESILKRADLVKFAKSAPDIELAKLDRNTIDIEIDHVKESLPEPTEEEKLLDQQYKEEQERKKKRKKIMLTVASCVVLLMATYVGFGMKYGFKNINDTLTRNEGKLLLEGTWIKSAYGFPPIYIETPQVLKREEVEIPEEIRDKVKSSLFRYLSKNVGIDIQVSTTEIQLGTDENGQPIQLSDDEKAQDLQSTSEKWIKKFEADGAKNISIKKDQFITPNAAEGLKTFGKMEFDDGFSANYTILLFRAESVRQQIAITWSEDNTYADKMVERILASIELKPLTEDDKE